MYVNLELEIDFVANNECHSISLKTCLLFIEIAFFANIYLIVKL